MDNLIDKINLWIWNFLIWFGVGFAAFMVCFGIYSMITSEDKIVGYTYHGTPIYSSEVDDGSEK